MGGLGSWYMARGRDQGPRKSMPPYEGSSYVRQLSALVLLFVVAFAAVHVINTVEPTAAPPLALAPGSPAVYRYKIIRKYPHSRQSFTQGLLFDENGLLLESTGMFKRTEVRRVELRTGVVRQRERASDRAFGEGLTLWRGLVLQLDWRKNTGFVYNGSTLERIGTLRHPYKDGWGITDSPSGKKDELVMTDSGHLIYFVRASLVPNTFDVELKEVHRRSVTDQGRLVTMVNELELVGHQVYANIFGKDCLAIIHADGTVRGWVDLAHLLSEEVPDRQGNNVLNGIAYHPRKPSRLFVTGKEWPSLFEIELIKDDQASADDLNRIRQMCIPTRNIFSGWTPDSID